MAKSFADRHPPRVHWDKLRNGPTPADLKEIPPASPAEWEKDGCLVSPLPEAVARKLEKRAKRPPRPRRKSAAAE